MTTLKKPPISLVEEALPFCQIGLELDQKKVDSQATFSLKSFMICAFPSINFVVLD